MAKKVMKKKVMKKHKSLAERAKEVKTLESKAPDTSAELAVLLNGIGDIKLLSAKAEQGIVPSVFTGFNRASRVGGIPLSCMILLHGPSKGGKTALAGAFVKSFQDHGHLSFYVDAEGTLSKTFYGQCEIRTDLLPYIIPDNYEQAVDKIDEVISNFAKGREKGAIDDSRGLLIVIDSLTKLAPKNELDAAKKVDKAFPLRALMNSIWLDKLTPRIVKLPITLVMIAHEKRVIDDRSPFPVYKQKGGDALVFDSSMVVRVDSARKVRRKVKKESVLVGQQHRAVVTKNKLGITSEEFHFVMSNGKGAASIGFDRAREIVLEARAREGTKCHLVYRSPWWHCPLFPDGKIKGEERVVRFLRQNRDVLNQLTAHMNDTAIDAIVKLSDEED